jgi:hypothetical protein
LVWFNEQCPEGKITILEKIIDPEREVEKEVMQWNNDTRRSERVTKRARGWAYFHVRVEDGKGKVGEAVKSETAVDFDDYIEKADTGATGRALAKIGYGTQFAPELDEQHRIVDAPVDRTQAAAGLDSRAANELRSGAYSEGQRTSSYASVSPSDQKTSGQAARSEDTNGNGRKPITALNRQIDNAQAPATDQQLASLRKLCQHLGKPEPENIDTLTHQAARELILQLIHEYNEQRQNSRKAS